METQFIAEDKALKTRFYRWKWGNNVTPYKLRHISKTLEEETGGLSRVLFKELMNWPISNKAVLVTDGDMVL